MTSTITIRLDDDVKEKLQKELDKAGISMDTFFTMAAKQTILQKKIPFEIPANSEEPSKITSKATKRVDSKDKDALDSFFIKAPESEDVSLDDLAKED